MTSRKALRAVSLIFRSSLASDAKDVFQNLPLTFTLSFSWRCRLVEY